MIYLMSCPSAHPFRGWVTVRLGRSRHRPNLDPSTFLFSNQMKIIFNITTYYYFLIVNIRVFKKKRL